MARPHILKDYKKIKKLIDDYMEGNNRPTLAGISRVLGIYPETLYNNIDREDDIGDLLLMTYLRLVELHEACLYDKACVGSIFWLKCLKKYMTWKENEGHGELSVKPTAFSFKIVEKDASNNTASN